MEPSDVKEWLKTRNMYASALAKKLGISRSLVYMWTQGERKIPAWLSLALAQIDEQTGGEDGKR
jgi:transcriptional regulator with XRE-family HTH domain